MHTVFKLQYFLCAITLFVCVTQCAERPGPLNGEFDIGREIITSPGYREVFSETLFFVLDRDCDILMDNGIGYGLSPHVGFTFTFPFLLRRKEEGNISRGLANLNAQLQWHLYRTDQHIAVLKTGVTFPTGGEITETAFGGKSFNFIGKFIGIHSSECLFASFIIDTLITTERKNKKPSPILAYELSIGPKFKLNTSDDFWLYTFLELEGIKIFPAKTDGMREPETSRHVTLVGPNISFKKGDTQLIGRILVPFSDSRLSTQQAFRYEGSLVAIISF